MVNSTHNAGVEGSSPSLSTNIKHLQASETQPEPVCRFLCGDTPASVAIPLAGALLALAIGYLFIQWVWRKLGEPGPEPTEQPAEWRDEH